MYFCYSRSMFILPKSLLASGCLKLVSSGVRVGGSVPRYECLHGFSTRISLSVNWHHYPD